MSAAPILIADDQRDVLEALRLLLKSEGYATISAGSPAEAVAALRERSPALVLMDLNYTRDTTSGQEGLDLIAQIRTADAEIPIVAMTAWGSIELVVKAMQAGAGDFIEKPWDNRRLLSVVRNQLALADSRRQNARLRRENEILKGEGNDDFIADAPAMRVLVEQLQRVAPTDANVLVLGENGTGKGVIARLIHANSRRAERPLVKVNMGGIAETVFESEMFGHVRGAYTDAKGDRIGRFELADGGTLFLDEIGNIPLSQQPKLLRVLEDGELERLGSSRTIAVDVRLISATNADVEAEIAAGRFRKDLLYRLNTVTLQLPPLRERREDIVPLARCFLARSATRYGREGLRLSAAAERALLGYGWPGNVRELAHLMERAVLMTTGAEVGVGDLALGGTGEPRPAGETPGAAGSAAAQPVPASLHGLTLDAAEEMLVRQALERSGGNIQRAADALGLSRPALYRRLEKYGIATGET
jgi:DNA-binding NtrC family response regulator